MVIYCLLITIRYLLGLLALVETSTTRAILIFVPIYAKDQVGKFMKEA
jgi:hypothetical protein